MAKLLMVSTNTGWAIGRASVLPTTILRTTDAGRSWYNVSPKHASAELVLNRSRYGLSKTSTWAAYFTPWGGHSVDIYRTTDGAKVWSPSRIVTKKQAGTISLSAVHKTAWLEVTPASALEGKPVPAKLFATEDGGKRWTRIAQFPNKSKLGLPGFGPIELVSGTVGFTVVNRRLYRTLDGGKTWHLCRLGTANDLQKVALPVLNGRDGLLFARLKSSDNVIFFRSTDSGASWSLLPNSLADVANVDIVNNEDVVAATHGGSTEVSTDGARTWQSSGPNENLRKYLSEYEIADADFISPQVGWLLLNNSYQAHKRILLQTVAGGRIWQVVK